MSWLQTCSFEHTCSELSSERSQQLCVSSSVSASRSSSHSLGEVDGVAMKYTTLPRGLPSLHYGAHTQCPSSLDCPNICQHPQAKCTRKFKACMQARQVQVCAQLHQTQGLVIQKISCKAQWHVGLFARQSRSISQRWLCRAMHTYLIHFRLTLQRCLYHAI